MSSPPCPHKDPWPRVENTPGSVMASRIPVLQAVPAPCWVSCSCGEWESSGMWEPHGAAPSDAESSEEPGVIKQLICDSGDVMPGEAPWSRDWAVLKE